jgi:hypothetical protein
MAAPPSAAIGHASCLLVLDPVTIVVGTHDGRLALYTRLADDQWNQASDTILLAGTEAVVEGVVLLLPGLLIVGSAGELSVRTVPALRRLDRGTIATRCTGAFCVQEKNLVAQQMSKRSSRSEPARVCAATFGWLLLLNVDDGAGDAQVGPQQLRTKIYAKIRVREPVAALLWRDAMLCVAHPMCHVVLDAATGIEVWRLHLRSPRNALAEAPAAGLGSSTSSALLAPALATASMAAAAEGPTSSTEPFGVMEPAALPQRTASASSSTGSSSRRSRFGSGGGACGAGSGEPRRSPSWRSRSRPAPPAPADRYADRPRVLLAGGVFGGSRHADEVHLVEQMLWEPSPSGSAAASAAAVSTVAGAEGGGLAAAVVMGGGGGRGGTLGSWVPEQGGRCFLDVARAVWYRSKGEATPTLPGRHWCSGWRVGFEHLADGSGWQYAPS